MEDEVDDIEKELEMGIWDVDGIRWEFRIKALFPLSKEGEG